MGEGRRGPGDFDDFFRERVSQARAVARRLLGPGPDVDDAVAEAFSRAWASWWRVGRLEHRDAWVMRVTANVAIDMVRRRRPAPAMAPSTAHDEDALAGRIALATALGGLARRQREVVLLRYLAGLSVDEVAASLKLSANTVKTHAARGTAALRTALGDELEGLDVEVV